MSELNSRQEYLKRYLDGPKIKKKKVKSSNAHKQSRFKIVDEDIDMKKIEISNKDDDEVGDEAPLIADVIDERPEHVKISEAYSSTRWKKFNSLTDNSEARVSDLVDSDSLNETNEREHNVNDDCAPSQAKAAKFIPDPARKASESKNLVHVRRHDSDSDASPLRGKTIEESDSDLSPSRSKEDNQRRGQRHLSPPQSNTKHSSASSPRKSLSKVQHSSDSDYSPPRDRSTSGLNKNYDSQIKKSHSLHSRSPRHSSDSDYSPPRGPTAFSVNKKYDSQSKKSQLQHSGSTSSRKSPPPERSHSKAKRKHPQPSLSLRSIEKSPQETSRDSEQRRNRPTSTLSGMKAGLQDSAALREETHKLKQRERVAINELSDELSGRNAETISRDRDTGRKRNLKEERLKQKEEEKKKAQKDEKYIEWGKGLTQKSEQHKKLQEDVYEMSKPLARYADDEDLEQELKDKLKEEDPMFHYIQKKRMKNQSNAQNLPVYQGPQPPPNRFNIPPGYRWDGVDRSNGFERKFFEKINNAKATEREAYLWSIENM